MSSMFSASSRKSSSSTMVSANSSTRAGGFARAATGMRPTRCGAIHAITAMSRSMRSRTRGRCTLTTTSSPLARVATCTWAIEAAASGASSKRRNTSLERPAEILLHDAAHGLEGLGRHLVAAELELLDELRREQAPPRGDDLGELDVRGAEALEGAPQAAREPAGRRARRRRGARAAPSRRRRRRSASPPRGSARRAGAAGAAPGARRTRGSPRGAPPDRRPRLRRSGSIRQGPSSRNAPVSSGAAGVIRRSLRRAAPRTCGAPRAPRRSAGSRHRRAAPSPRRPAGRSASRAAPRSDQPAARDRRLGVAEHPVFAGSQRVELHRQVEVRRDEAPGPVVRRLRGVPGQEIRPEQGARGVDHRIRRRRRRAGASRCARRPGPARTPSAPDDLRGGARSGTTRRSCRPARDRDAAPRAAAPGGMSPRECSKPSKASATNQAEAVRTRRVALEQGRAQRLGAASAAHRLHLDLHRPGAARAQELAGEGRGPRLRAGVRHGAEGDRRHVAAHRSPHEPVGRERAAIAAVASFHVASRDRTRAWRGSMHQPEAAAARGLSPAPRRVRPRGASSRSRAASRSSSLRSALRSARSSRRLRRRTRRRTYAAASSIRCS